VSLTITIRVAEVTEGDLREARTLAFVLGLRHHGLAHWIAKRFGREPRACSACIQERVIAQARADWRAEAIERTGERR
jgi:hypothetical protein